MRCERTARASFCFAVSNIVRGMATMTIVYGLVIMMLTMLGSNQVPPDFSGVWQLNLGESTILGSKPQWTSSARPATPAEWSRSRAITAINKKSFCQFAIVRTPLAFELIQNIHFDFQADNVHSAPLICNGAWRTL